MGSKFNMPEMSFEQLDKTFPRFAEAVRKCAWMFNDINRKHKCEEDDENADTCTFELRQKAFDTRLDVEIAKIMMDGAQHLDQQRALEMLRDALLYALGKHTGEPVQDVDIIPDDNAIEASEMLFKRLSGGKPLN